jgi:hypothetical protein
MTAEQIGKAGIRVFFMMYGGKKKDLNFLRHAKFMEMAISSKINYHWIPKSFHQ